MAPRTSEKTRSASRSRSRSPAVTAASGRRGGSRSPSKRASPSKRRSPSKQPSPAKNASPTKAAATVRRGGAPVNFAHVAKRAIAVYLVAYNALSACAWIAVLVRVLAAAGPAFAKAWAASARATRVSALCAATAAAARAGQVAGSPMLAAVQSCAILEVAHAALGFVPAPVLQTAVQVLSRLLVGVQVVHRMAVGRATGHWAFLAIVVAWSLADATRYAYYVLNMSGRAPAALRWLRYSLFLVLYPVGTLGEMALLWAVRGAMSGAVRHLLLVLLVLYPLGLAAMYAHMLSQRARHVPSAAVRKSPRKTQ